MEEKNINVIYQKEKMKTEYQKQPFSYSEWVENNKQTLKPPGKIKN
jgi:hypothetical protein